MKQTSAIWQEVEKEAMLCRQLIKRLPAEERVEAAKWMVLEIIVTAGDSAIEWLGILETAKFELMADAFISEGEEESG